ncbi:MAG: hypothetical protein WKG03_11245 [Telluria sp.]
MKIETRLMDEEEYNSTFRPPMLNVTENADEIVDLWAYADLIIYADYHNCTAWEWRVEHIYETADNTFQHIGIPVPTDDTYLTIVVDVQNRRIAGHYLLDLRRHYGMS